MVSHPIHLISNTKYDILYAYRINKMRVNSDTKCHQKRILTHGWRAIFRQSRSFSFSGWPLILDISVNVSPNWPTLVTNTCYVLSLCFTEFLHLLQNIVQIIIYLSQLLALLYVLLKRCLCMLYRLSNNYVVKTLLRWYSVW